MMLFGEKKDYNIIIIGAGAAGLSAAWMAAKLKARVLLVESEKTGGECLYYGCVPSKSLIAYAKKNSVNKSSADFQLAKKYIRDKIKKIEPHDSIARYRQLGVDVIIGRAEIYKSSVKVGSQTFTSRSIIIATGSRPSIPLIHGIDSTPYYTYQTVWDMPKLPKQLTIIGGGAAGCELADAFTMLGSRVTIIEKEKHLLPAEDDEIGEFLAKDFYRKGIRVLTDAEILSMSNAQEISIKLNNKKLPIRSNALLILAGKKAAVPDGCSDLNLLPSGFIATDRFMRTSGKNIFAIGDITGKMMQTNAAANQAAIAVINALFSPFRIKFTKEDIPYAIFTNPEIARVGLNKEMARRKKIDYREYKFPFSTLNRAIIEEEEGFIHILTNRYKRILGIVIVGTNASEMIGEFVLAKRLKMGANKILLSSHVYPSNSEAAVYLSGIVSGDNLQNGFLPVLLHTIHKFLRFF